MTKLFNMWRHFSPVTEQATGAFGELYSYNYGSMIIPVKLRQTIVFGDCMGNSLNAFVEFESQVRQFYIVTRPFR